MMRCGGAHCHSTGSNQHARFLHRLGKYGVKAYVNMYLKYRYTSNRLEHGSKAAHQLVPPFSAAAVTSASKNSSVSHAQLGKNQTYGVRYPGGRTPTLPARKVTRTGFSLFSRHADNATVDKNTHTSASLTRCFDACPTTSCMSTWLHDPHPAPPAPHQPLSSVGSPTEAAPRSFSPVFSALALLELAAGLAAAPPPPPPFPHPHLAPPVAAAAAPTSPSDDDGVGDVAAEAPDAAAAGDGGVPAPAPAPAAAAAGGDTGDGGSTMPLARGDHGCSWVWSCCRSCWVSLLLRRERLFESEFEFGGATPNRTCPPRLRTSSRPWFAAIWGFARLSAREYDSTSGTLVHSHVHVP